MSYYLPGGGQHTAVSRVDRGAAIEGSATPAHTYTGTSGYVTSQEYSVYDGIACYSTTHDKAKQYKTTHYGVILVVQECRKMQREKGKGTTGELERRETEGGRGGRGGRNGGRVGGKGGEKRREGGKGEGRETEEGREGKGKRNDGRVGGKKWRKGGRETEEGMVGEKRRKGERGGRETEEGGSDRGEKGVHDGVGVIYESGERGDKGSEEERERE